MGNQFSDPVERESFYFHMKAGAESGWDYSTRWMINKQVSNSSIFYEQLLRAQIPNVQKDSQVMNIFFVLLGSACAKAAHRSSMTPTFKEQQTEERLYLTFI
jgi:neutral trehalase